MSDLPQKGTFKIATVGPKKDIPKKDNPHEFWSSYSLQFQGDPNWYDTFWTAKETPTEGLELTGTKSEHEKFGLQFSVDRPNSKSNWNPAGAQASVVGAAVDVVNGFLSLGNNYELWKTNDKEVKVLFNKYMATVESAAKQVKEIVVSLGKLNPEQKVADTTSTVAKSPNNPPEIEGWPEDEHEVEV